MWRATPSSKCTEEANLIKKGILIIFSGLPASGKTTLASKLATHIGATYLRVDTIEASLREGTEIPDLGIKCYRVAQFIAGENLRLGNSVVGDSVNPVEASRNGWNEVAKSVKSKFINIEVVCSNKEEHQARLKTRTTTLAGLTDPTWKEVQEREYYPWNQDRILIETSNKDVEMCFSEILAALKEKT